ncbi:hypothetical protein C8T65DRAFT_738035 [Cerioporus squamosus]|nr:hypothetical protein C8T65DRAFT_738035 [Cerioporus squamosus]
MLVEPDTSAPDSFFTIPEHPEPLPPRPPTPSASTPHSYFYAHEPDMSQDDSTPTELRYTATLEPQVAFPCAYGYHDAHLYQDWYVPAAVLTGTLSDSANNVNTAPFSCQGPAYIRLYPTAHLNALRCDAITADFQVPTLSARRNSARDATPSSLPELVSLSSSANSTTVTLRPSPRQRLDTAKDEHRVDGQDQAVQDKLLPPASLLFTMDHGGGDSGSESEAEDEWNRVVNSPEDQLLTTPEPEEEPAHHTDTSTLERYRELVVRYRGFYDTTSPEAAIAIADCIDNFYPAHHPSLHGFPPLSPRYSALDQLDYKILTDALQPPTSSHHSLDIISPVPIPHSHSLPIAAFQTACERILEDPGTRDEDKRDELDRLYDDLEAGRLQHGHLEPEHEDNSPTKRGRLELELEEPQDKSNGHEHGHEHNDEEHRSSKRARRDDEHDEHHKPRDKHCEPHNGPVEPESLLDPQHDENMSRVPLVSYDEVWDARASCLASTSAFEPLPPLLLSFYTVPVDSDVPDDVSDDHDDRNTSPFEHPLDIVDFPLPLSPEHTTPRPVTPSTPATTPEPPSLTPAQQREYEQLFGDGALRDFVECILLDAMQDATNDLCEFFREEFEVFQAH